MKEPYFTTDTIEQGASDIIQRLDEYRGRLRILFEPEKAALIVLDMQRYFLDEESHAYIPSGEAIIPGLLQLIEAFQVWGQPIILTRHQNTLQNAGSLSRWWNDLIVRGNPMSEFHPNFQEVEAEAEVLEKTQYDAFYGTDLERILREAGITQLVIGGVMTHLCCETTARSAFVRGFDVFFLVDGTATYNIEFHMSSLLTLTHGFVHPVRFQEILDKMPFGDEYEERDVEGDEVAEIDIREIEEAWKQAGNEE